MIIKQDKQERADMASKLDGTLNYIGESAFDIGAVLIQMKMLGGLTGAATGSKALLGQQKLKGLAQLKSHLMDPSTQQMLGRIALHGFFTSEGTVGDRGQSMIRRIAYNATPFVANATGLTGMSARAVDIGLNVALTEILSKSYSGLIKKANDGTLTGKEFNEAIWNGLTDVIFAWSTKGYPENIARKKLVGYYTSKNAELQKLGKPGLSPEELATRIRNIRASSPAEALQGARALETGVDYKKLFDKVQSGELIKEQQAEITKDVEAMKAEVATFSKQENIMSGKEGISEVKTDIDPKVQMAQGRVVSHKKKGEKKEKEFTERMDTTPRGVSVKGFRPGELEVLLEDPKFKAQWDREYEKAVKEKGEALEVSEVLVAVANNLQKKKLRKKVDKAEIKTPEEAAIILEAEKLIKETPDPKKKRQIEKKANDIIKQNQEIVKEKALAEDKVNRAAVEVMKETIKEEVPGLKELNFREISPDTVAVDLVIGKSVDFDALKRLAKSKGYTKIAFEVDPEATLRGQDARERLFKKHLGKKIEHGLYEIDKVEPGFKKDKSNLGKIEAEADKILQAGEAPVPRERFLGIGVAKKGKEATAALKKLQKKYPDQSLGIA